MIQALSDTPVLYSFRRCPYAMRARLALAVSGQKCLLREIILRDKPEEMLAVSPKGTVPVLQLQDGQIIAESLDIMMWALEQNDPAGWLAHSGEQQTEMMALISVNDGKFKHHLDRYKYPDRYEDVDPLEHRAQGEDIIKQLDLRLSQAGWLMGTRPSLADFAIAPFIRQFANTDRDWFDQTAYKNLQEWLARFLTSDLFVSIMKKYKPWKQTGDLILFPED